MIIEIKGVQFVNKGAELMLHAVIQQIEERWPDSAFVLAPNNNSPYFKRAKIGAYQKLSLATQIIDLNILSYWIPKKIRSVLKNKFGIVTEADISVIFDASGFAYGDQWGSSSILALKSELKRAKVRNKKYIFLPQALGPFSSDRDIKHLKSHLSEASLICAREDSSFENVKKIIGNSRKLYKYPDFTNLVVGVLPEYFTNGNNKVLIIPNSNMISSRNTESAWKNNYIRVLSDSIDVIREQNLIPVLLNHEGAGDEAICKQIKEMSCGHIDIINEEDPIKVKGIIGASRGIICSRFHGCVSALSQGIPCLGTSWSHKYERLFEEYLQSECLIGPTITKDQLNDTFLKSTELCQKTSCIKARNIYKSSAIDMWNQVEKVID